MKSSKQSPSSPSTNYCPPISILQNMNLIELDTRWSWYIHTKCMALPRPILRALEVSGDGLFWIPTTAALWLAPFPLAGFSKLRWFCLNFFIGLIFDLILIGTLKSLIKRPRPAYNKGMYLVLSVDHWSFPSGHASRACFIGSFLWLCLSVLQEIRVQMAFNSGVAQAVVVDPNLGLDDGGLIKAGIVIMMMWSIATSTSRILLGRHFMLDVVAGAILGVLEAFIVYYLLFVSERFSEASYLWIADLISSIEDEETKGVTLVRMIKSTLRLHSHAFQEKLEEQISRGSLGGKREQLESLGESFCEQQKGSKQQHKWGLNLKVGARIQGGA